MTDEYIIAVDLEEVIATNGSLITSYHVEIDDGDGGQYTSLKGELSEDTTLSASKQTTIVPGKLYRARYRAKNEVGFGEYSEPGYILAAGKPYESDAVIVEIIDNEVIFKWVMPYNAGSPIIDAQI